MTNRLLLLSSTCSTTLVHTTEEGFKHRYIKPLSVHTMIYSRFPFTACQSEDASGSFPIHYAAQRKIKPPWLFIQRYPQAAFQQGSGGSISGRCVGSDGLLENRAGVVVLHHR
jgi:hypothetical protein